MWLVDTSVWIEHFRHGRNDLRQLLMDGLVLMHPWICGELSCGNLKDRVEILSDINTLPTAKLATNTEASRLIDERKLWGRGLGWVDVHLLASALLSQSGFWTLDKRLARLAIELRLS
jgi:predicted nucleic acid-binding protein